MTIPGLTFFDHESGKLGLFELMDVKERAASILGGKTDIMTRNSLHPRLRKRIEEAAVLIFDGRTNCRAPEPAGSKTVRSASRPVINA